MRLTRILSGGRSSSLEFRAATMSTSEDFRSNKMKAPVSRAGLFDELVEYLFAEAVHGTLAEKMNC